jgi:hypothetical protein
VVGAAAARPGRAADDRAGSADAVTHWVPV